VDDVAIYVMPGRVKGPAQGHGRAARRAIDEAIDAEQIGIRSAFISERHDLKHAPVLLGGMGERTTRLELGTSPVVTNSRPPIVMASFAATMVETYGERFILALGRGNVATETHEAGKMKSYPFGASFEAFADYIDIVRRLLRGETVTYDGPAGRFDEVGMADQLEAALPEIWSVTLGGPKASKVAGQAADGLLITPMLTPEACAKAVAIFREERERRGLDPAGGRVVQSVVTACEMDDEKTLGLTAARFLTYVIGLDFVAPGLCRRNGWDVDIVHRIADHPMLKGHANVDEGFYRDQILEPAKFVPEEWMRDSCAIGSIDECLDKWQEFRDAGADQIMIYGSTPQENAKLIEAWRAR
jgi:probable F420-dependent oxidoreductase